MFIEVEHNRISRTCYRHSSLTKEERRSKDVCRCSREVTKYRDADDLCDVDGCFSPVTLQAGTLGDADKKGTGGCPVIPVLSYTVGLYFVPTVHIFGTQSHIYSSTLFTVTALYSSVSFAIHANEYGASDCLL